MAIFSLYSITPSIFYGAKLCKMPARPKLQSAHTSENPSARIFGNEIKKVRAMEMYFSAIRVFKIFAVQSDCFRKNKKDRFCRQNYFIF